MIVGYTLLFCRALLALVFAVAATRKGLNLAEFQQSIAAFQVLPRRLNLGIAISVVVAELVTSALLVVGGNWSNTAFMISAVLIAIFSAVIVSALIRRIRASCNCFGKGDKNISWLTFIRNIVLLFVALLGSSLSFSLSLEERLSTGEWRIPTVVAILAMFGWTQLEAVARISSSK